MKDLLSGKNWAFHLALALPVLMILFVAGSIYVPRWFAPEPRYDFVYSEESYNAEYTVYVSNGHVVREDSPKIENEKYVEPKFYYYDTAAGEARRMSFDEVESLSLDDRNESPDGYTVKRSDGYSSGPFGGSNESGIYLAGHATGKKLDLRGIDDVYSFKFIGWVKK